MQHHGKRQPNNICRRDTQISNKLGTGKGENSMKNGHAPRNLDWLSWLSVSTSPVCLTSLLKPSTNVDSRIPDPHDSQFRSFEDNELMIIDVGWEATEVICLVGIYVYYIPGFSEWPFSGL